MRTTTGVLIGPLTAIVLWATSFAAAQTAVAPAQLDRETITAVVESRMQTVQSCYRSALAERPSMQGRVVVQIIIDTDGSVRSAHVTSSTLDHAGVESCVRQEVMQMRFPAPPNGVVALHYPFEFQLPATTPLQVTGPETTGTCAEYIACCFALADAFRGIEGVDETTGQAMEEACISIRQIENSPGADEACAVAMDAIRQTEASYTAVPGFHWPDACH